MDDLDLLGFRLREAAAAPAGMLVLFHGRATDESDLFPLLDAVDPDRRLVGVTPRGPLSLPPGGAHWYRLGELGFPDSETFGATYARIGAWLDALAEHTGVPIERTVLGGFSQGTVMSFALGLGSDRPRPAGIVAMSGFVPTVAGWSPDLANPPKRIAVAHGTLDQVIPVEFARRTRALLEPTPTDLLYREPPVPHTVDPGFLDELQPWLLETLPDPPADA